MGSQPKSSKLAKPPNQSPPTSRSSSSSLSSHLAMVELKQRILTSLSKLTDRDTYQIAIEDLEKIIQSISPEAIPMLLNCLYDASADPKPAVKKESLKLLTSVCASHGDSTSTHLTKIIAHIVRRLKDSDSGVRDACRDAIGTLSAQYLKGDASGGDNGGLGSVLSLFVKPLFEAMGEQNKGVQSGAAMCMAKMVECASSPPVSAFQKLCPKICKLLNNPNFLAKSALLPIVANLSQVGAIAPQSLDHLLQSTHECLGSADWATRKAAAETLTALALHSSSLITDGGDSTLTALEACRFDKIKPVRDSITEALQLWKKIAGKADEEVGEAQKASAQDELSEQTRSSEKENQKKTSSNEGREPQSNDILDSSASNSNSVDKTKCGSIPDKAVVILKKKAPALTDKELNPEFFQKLTRGSGELPVEVILPRRCVSSSNSKNEELEPNNSEHRGKSSRHADIHSDDWHGPFNIKYRNLERGAAISHPKIRDHDDLTRDKLHDGRANGKESRTKGYDGDDRTDSNYRDSAGSLSNFSKAEAQLEGSFMNNKGSWLAIQRQLLQMERQQAHLMNMVQDFIGGSHDSMVTLENRVRGLERIVEDMARDLSGSSGRRSNFVMGFEGSSNRHLGKYNALPDYSGAKFARSGDSRIPYGERFNQTDGISSFMRGRGPPWRSDMHDNWDMPGYGTSRNGQIVSKRAPSGGSMDGRSPKSENESDQVASRRAWGKGGGPGPVRHGEGPSARSVWQASKDEATLEAIRVAGEDCGTSRTARVPIPESTAVAMADGNAGQERDLVWTSWRNAMDALNVGDMDSAYAEVLSTSDGILLVKLMDKSGPVIDLLTNEVATDVLHAVGQFLHDQNLFDICLSWIQQLVDNVNENGADFLGIPMELKKEILLNLHEAALTMELPDDWDGAPPYQLLSQLASAWEIDLRQHE